jgi:hypothetical protein
VRALAERPPPPTVDPKVIDGLAGRLTVLEAAARISVAAAALTAAVERGGSFAGELAALQALGVDPKALAPLAPFAASGVPSAAALSGELLALMPALNKAGGTPAPEGGVLARLAAGAQSLVRIRPVGDVKGDDPAAILARIELRATKSDIPGALAELAKLPDGARAPAQAFIAKAQGREAALDASRRLAADALAALAKSPETR